MPEAQANEETGSKGSEVEDSTEEEGGADESAETEVEEESSGEDSGGKESEDEGDKGDKTPSEEEEDSASEDGEKDKGDDKTGKADGDKELSLKASKDSLLSADQVGSIEAFAKEQKMSQKQAQATLDREEKRQLNYVELNKPFGPAWKERVAVWEAEVKADKKIGGTKEKLAETVHYASVATNAIFGKKMLQYIEETGIGSHPEFLRNMARHGRKMSPDKAVHGKTSTTKEVSDGEMLFGEGTEEKPGEGSD